MINKNKNGFWRFDEHDMCLEPWEENGSQDGLGRNAFLYINYPHYKWLKDSLLRCIKQRDDTFVQFYRYPDKGADTISRDHVGAVILALYENQDWDELKFILDNLPWRLSRKYTQTIDFWLWQKMIKAEINQKVNLQNLLSYTLLFLILIQTLVFIPLNRLIRFILGIKGLELKDFPNQKVKSFKGSARLLYKLHYPTFSLFLLAFQLKTISKGSLLNKLIRTILSTDLTKDQLVLKYILTDNPITTEQYNKYKGLTSFIWSRRLDNTDEVYINKMNENEKLFNDINQSMLDYCYYQIDKTMNTKVHTFVKINNTLINY